MNILDWLPSNKEDRSFMTVVHDNGSTPIIEVVAADRVPVKLFIVFTFPLSTLNF